MAPAVLDPVQVVGLEDVQVRVGQRGDRTRVVQERVRVALVRLEHPAVDDVGPGVAVVVDVDVVVDAVGPGVEVRAAGRFLERDPVADEGHGARPVRTPERVQVRGVDLWIRGHERRLAVAGRLADPRPEARDQPAAQGHHGAGRDRRPAKTFRDRQRSSSCLWMRGGHRRPDGRPIRPPRHLPERRSRNLRGVPPTGSVDLQRALGRNWLRTGDRPSEPGPGRLGGTPRTSR